MQETNSVDCFAQSQKERKLKMSKEVKSIEKEFDNASVGRLVLKLGLPAMLAQFFNIAAGKKTVAVSAWLQRRNVSVCLSLLYHIFVWDCRSAVRHGNEQIYNGAGLCKAWDDVRCYWSGTEYNT